MTIQPEPYTPKVGKRFVVYSKFPSYTVAAVEPFILVDDMASFDLLVYLLVDDINTETIALDWMQKKEAHRVKLCFLDANGDVSASWAFEEVTVEAVGLDGVNWNSEQPVMMRVGCTGKLVSLK